MLKKYIHAIKKLLDADFRFIFFSEIGFHNNMNDEMYLKRMYKSYLHKELNLDLPTTFNEKLQWLKLYNRNPLYTDLVDKVKVKHFVANIIGEDYIIPTLGTWDSPEQIDFSKLPDRFVLKCNHNSGYGMCICKDKSLLNIKKTIKKLRKGLKENKYLLTREWPYKDVQRKVLAEKYMEDPLTSELRDYKFFCFNGKVKCFKVDFDRFVNHRANYYDPQGKLLHFEEIVCPADEQRNILIPDNLSDMVTIAEKLSADFPFIRVDLYNVNGHIYFGEMTFFPNSGFGMLNPEEWDTTLGNWLELPCVKRV